LYDDEIKKMQIMFFIQADVHVLFVIANFA